MGQGLYPSEHPILACQQDPKKTKTVGWHSHLGCSLGYWVLTYGLITKSSNAKARSSSISVSPWKRLSLGEPKWIGSQRPKTAQGLKAFTCFGSRALLGWYLGDGFILWVYLWRSKHVQERDFNWLFWGAWAYFAQGCSRLNLLSINHLFYKLKAENHWDTKPLIQAFICWLAQLQPKRGQRQSAFRDLFR